MNASFSLKLGKYIFLISLIAGTLILAIAFTGIYPGLILQIGSTYTFIAIIVNSFILLGLWCHALFDKEHRIELFASGLMLLVNIPICMLYITIALVHL